MKVRNGFYRYVSSLLVACLLIFGLSSEIALGGIEPELKQYINGYDLVSSDSTLVLNDPKSFDIAGNYLQSYTNAGYKE